MLTDSFPVDFFSLFNGETMINNILKTTFLIPFLIATTANANNITVLNHNFEFDAIPPAPGHTSTITGWFNSGLGNAGVLAPITGQDYHAHENRGQVAFISYGGRIGQTTPIPLLVGETYTLSFEAGQALSQVGQHFVVRFKANRRNAWR